jgi:hypothetical protein
VESKTAFDPQEGQSVGNFVDPSKLPKGLLIKDEGGFLFFNPSMFHDVFAQDVDSAQASIMASVQKPINSSIFAEKSGPPPDTTSYYSQFFTMKGIENIALKKLNHFRSYVTRSTYIGISRVYGEYLTYNDSNYYKRRKSSNISYR